MRTAVAQRMIVALFSTASLVALASPALASTATVQEAAKLQTLFEEEWQWVLREYPEFATRVGDPRYNDKLTDLSESALIGARRTSATSSSASALSTAPC